MDVGPYVISNSEFKSYQMSRRIICMHIQNLYYVDMKLINISIYIFKYMTQIIMNSLTSLPMLLGASDNVISGNDPSSQMLTRQTKKLE